MGESRCQVRIDTVVPIRDEVRMGHHAILEVADEVNSPLTPSETVFLAQLLQNYRFVIAVIPWHDILLKNGLDIQGAIEQMEKTRFWVRNDKHSGLEGVALLLQRRHKCNWNQYQSDPKSSDERSCLVMKAEKSIYLE